MFQADPDRPVIIVRRNLLLMAIQAYMDHDQEFITGMDPEESSQIQQIYDSLDILFGLVRRSELEQFRDKAPRVVAELAATGWSETAANLLSTVYRGIPVTPRRFLTDPYYAGKFGEGLYPVNFRDACWLLNPRNQILEVVLTGATRWGKTTMAVMLIAYRLYLLSLMRDPQAFFGLMHGSSIRYGIFNVFKYKTGEMQERLQAIIDDSPYFKKEFPRLSGEKSKEIILPNRISVIEGSTELHALGETLIGAILDEVNYMRQATGRARGTVQASLGQAQKLYTAIRGRLRNQFVASPGSTAPYLMCMLSQRLAQTSFLEQHIKDHGHETGVCVISRAIWDVQPEGTYSGKTFWIFCGDSTAGARILNAGEEQTIGDANLVEAPEEHRAQAKSALEDFIRNSAGRATVAASALFRMPESIVAAANPVLKHPFASESVVLSTATPFELYQAAIPDLLFQTVGSSVPRLDPRSPRFLHVDLAANECSAGMACVHVPESAGNESIAWLDFALRIDPPERGHGAEIDFDKILNFIIWLHQNGYTFGLVSFDTWQSRHSMQRLRKLAIATDYISMDASDDPYINLRGYYESGRIKTYRHTTLEKELSELEYDITTQKVYKPQNGSKDVSDALAGAVYGMVPSRKRLANKEKIQNRIPIGGPLNRAIIAVGGEE